MLFQLPISFHDSKKESLPVCPCCAQRFHHEAECCPLCGFSFQRVQQKFGDEQISMRRIDDKAGCLRKNQRENLAAKLAKWEKKCPPLVLSVHIPLSVEYQQLRQYSTWLLNSMALNEPDLDRPDWTILLVVDINHKAAVLSYGYKLEPYLTEELLYPALDAGAPYLRSNLYEQGIAAIMKKARNIVARRARLVNGNKKRPADFSETKEGEA